MFGDRKELHTRGADTNVPAPFWVGDVEQYNAFWRLFTGRFVVRREKNIGWEKNFARNDFSCEAPPPQNLFKIWLQCEKFPPRGKVYFWGGIKFGPSRGTYWVWKYGLGCYAFCLTGI